MDDGCRDRPPPREHSRELQDADEDAEHDGDHERGRCEEAERVAPAEAAHQLAAPAAGGVELPREAGPALTRPVGHRERGIEPHAVPGPADAEIELPVLASADRLVEQADLVEDGPAHDPEVRRLRLAFDRAAVIRAAAQADGGVVGARDGPLERRAAIGAHDAADVRGAHPRERRESPARVIGLQLGMRVDAHDRRVAAGADGRIEADRDVGRRVVDEHDPVVRCRDLPGELGRSIRRGPERQDQLERTVELLSEHRLDGAAQVAALVEHGHDEAHPRVVRDGGRILAPGL
jgi:hypothetical protein